MTLLYLKARIMATKLPKSETGASWRNKCGAAVNTLGERAASNWHPRVVGPSVGKNVRPASMIVSSEPSKAPAGAQHWWSGGANDDGHVATDLLGGGKVCFMASSTLAEQWQPYLGVNSVAKYSTAHRNDLKYVGWSIDYAGASYMASDVRYIDWWEWQDRLKHFGYDGPVDGLPGPKTLTALKRFLASQNGYKGPIDGTFDDAALAAFTDALSAPEPEPEPEPPVNIPEPPQEDPMNPEQPPAVTVPPVPDVVLSKRARSILYISNWLAGVTLAAGVAGWIATSTPAPTWLLVTLAIYGSISSNVSLIAKANLNK